MCFLGAIKTLGTDDHNKTILELLPNRKALVEVFAPRGWATDARAILIRDTQEDTHLPTEWYSAEAEFHDRSTHGALLDRMVNGWDRVPSYETIETLPGIRLDDAVETLFSRSQSS